MEKGLWKSKNVKFWWLLVISVWQISKFYLNTTFLYLKYYLILAGTPLNSKFKTALIDITINFSAPHTGAHYSIDTFANCRKVEHDKLWKYNAKVNHETKNFENPSSPLVVRS